MLIENEFIYKLNTHLKYAKAIIPIVVCLKQKLHLCKKSVEYRVLIKLDLHGCSYCFKQTLLCHGEYTRVSKC